MLTQVHTNLWTLDGPYATFVGAKTNTRMTIAKLSNGSLWVHSPIAWSSEVADFVESLGNQVSAIIAPNKYHYLWLDQWQARFPRATTFAEPALRNRIKKLSKSYSPDQKLSNSYPKVIQKLLSEKKVTLKVTPTNNLHPKLPAAGWSRT